MTKITVSSELDVEYMQHMGSDSSILAAMLVSTAGHDAQAEVDADPSKARGRLSFLMRDRHGSPFEHGSLTIRVRAPIMVYREWHRHRVGMSYNEESARYTKLEPRFYIPSPERPLVQIGKTGKYEFVSGSIDQYETMVGALIESYQQSYDAYEEMLDAGIAREVARLSLPVSIYSSMYCTLNPRSIMSFLSLRTRDDGATFPSGPQWEIEQCALKLERIFAEHWPITAELFREHGSVSP